MDANGTRYHLLLGYDDWSNCSDGRMRLCDGWQDEQHNSFVMWDSERAALTLEPRIFQFIAAQKNVPPKLDDRRGAGRDRYGNWYWVDATGRQIRVNSEGTRRASNFWPPDPGSTACASPAHGAGDFQPRATTGATAQEFHGLAVTEDHYLVVGVLEPKGLLIFDLHAGGQPKQLLWPTEVDFEPFDMAAAPGGGVWILDRKHLRYWALDRHFNVVRHDEQQEVELSHGGRDDFQARGGGPPHSTAPRTFPLGISLPDVFEQAGLDPIAIEALPDGTVLILVNRAGGNFSDIYRFRFQQQLGEPDSTEKMRRLIEDELKEKFRLVGFDLAVVPRHQANGAEVPLRLYVVADDGNQTFAFTLNVKDDELELEPLPNYLPMRLFGGKGLVEADRAVHYDYGEGWIPLTEQRRPRYALEATVLTPLNPEAATGADGPDEVAPRHAFDGREPDCLWHRLMLDACIPPETKVSVWSRAANDERELALAVWQPEPNLYLRGDGSELPYVSAPASEGQGTWELLFQRARGRFLQLKLELGGNGRRTPRLHALRVYYPRFSYLEHYLPAVYREDARSASFLDRFLANLEGIHTAVEDKIAAAQILFDVRSAPPETLDWLSGWFAVALDPTWNDTRRRLFLRHAMTFFQYRGSIRGLKMALRLALDDCPDHTIFSDSEASSNSIRVIEKYRTRNTPGVVVGDPTDSAGLRVASPGERWYPSLGGVELHKRYTAALFIDTEGQRFNSFPIVPPTPDILPHWQDFARDALGFIPSAANVELEQWQKFLERRYQTIEALNTAHGAAWQKFDLVPLPSDVVPGSAHFLDWRDFAAETAYLSTAVNRRRWQDFLARRYLHIAQFNKTYGTQWTSFELISLPSRLPADGAPLLDWFQFEAIVQHMWQSAHRFTVLLPIPPTAARDSVEYQRRLELASRLVRLEKPAHTVYDIKFYWALFRIGSARLGQDTLVDLGGRSPELMRPMVLGQGHLAETYIAPTHPQDVADRRTLGYEHLGG